MKQQRDHYAVLGVASDATPQEITHAYRILLRRHHPDTRGHDAASTTTADADLRRIISAYAVLRDPESRVRYDQSRQRVPIAPKRREPERSPLEQPPIVAGPVRWHPSTTRTGNRV